MRIILRLALVTGGFAFVCGSAYGQQVNPNNLPPCPKPDYSKTLDVGSGGRTEKWSNCWGRYMAELSAAQKGDVLEGEWNNGLPNGFATCIETNGNKYVGTYQDGHRDGTGTYFFASGEKYTGEWKRSMKNGKGIQTRPDGTNYSGYWKDNAMHGEGVLIWSDGRRQEGIFENNNFIREVKISFQNQVEISPKNLSLQDAGEKCKELGFKTGTERYGKCVLELSR